MALTQSGGIAGIGHNRNLFIKIIPPTRWGRKPSSEWERGDASRADRPQCEIIVVGVVVVVVEYNIIYIYIIVDSRVPRRLVFCLFFTTLFACHPLKTVVLEQRRHAADLLL